MGYPMVRAAVEADRLTLHGWHYVLEEGDVHVFDVNHGGFLPASQASHCGTGPYPGWCEAPQPSGSARG
jgi:carbonic anhydrase